MGNSFRLATGAPVQDLRFKGQASNAIGRNGEVNASSQSDLLAQIGQLMQSVSSGVVVKDHSQGDGSFMSLSNDAKTDILNNAINDSEKWAVLGANIAEDVQEQASRQGFIRNLAVVNNLRQGEIQRVPMPRHQTVAAVATSPSGLSYQLMRDRYYTPPEFELKANVRVNKLDMGQATHDLLDHAYNDALEAMMTAADRIWKSAADSTVGKANNLSLITGRLTPSIVARLRTEVTNWSLPARKAIISNNLWEDVISEPSWADALTPVAQYELLMTGRVGTMYGMEIFTDGFRPANQIVLGKNELYVVSDPEFHATMGSRGGIESTPTDGANQGETTKGWLLSEIMSFILPNPRSVAKAQRI